MPASTPAPPSDPRRCTEHGFPTHDDVSLFYRHWPARGDASTGAIILIVLETIFLGTFVVTGLHFLA